jgi:hypothetical protein
MADAQKSYPMCLFADEKELSILNAGGERVHGLSSQSLVDEEETVSEDVQGSQSDSSKQASVVVKFFLGDNAGSMAQNQSLKLETIAEVHGGGLEQKLGGGAASGRALLQESVVVDSPRVVVVVTEKQKIPEVRCSERLATVEV